MSAVRDAELQPVPAASHVVVVTPRDAAEAGRLVAGVSHLARAVIAARREGVRRVFVRLDAPPALRRQVSEELARADCPAAVDWLCAREDAPIEAREVALADPRAVAREVLLGTAKPSDGLVSRTLNRPVSRWISARVLTLAALRPWHLTLLTAAIALAMFAILVWGGETGLVVGGLLFHLASVIDGVDGEMARATFRTSRSGAMTDTLVDMATNLLFVLGLTLGLTRLYGDLYAKVGGLVFALLLLGLALLAGLVRLHSRGTSFDLLKVIYAGRYPTGWVGRIVGFFRIVTSRDTFAFSFAIIAVCGGAPAIPWVLLFFAVFWLGAVVYAVPVVLASRRNGPGEPSAANQGL